MRNFLEAYIWLLVADEGGEERAGAKLFDLSKELSSEEIKYAKSEAMERFAEIEAKRGK